MGCYNDYDGYGCRNDRRYDCDRCNDWDDHGPRRPYRSYRRRRPNRGPEFGVFFGFPRTFR